MNEQEMHRVIKKLNSPARVLAVPVKDLYLYGIPSICTLVLTSSMLITFGVLVLMRFVKLILQKLPQRYGARCFYWYFPSKIANAFFGLSFAPSHVKFWFRR